jgi:hypothetical protein
MGVTTAVQFAAGTAKELQTRHRSNTFLEEMNEQIFKPRGLYAMVMAFDPSPDKKIENKQINLADTISKFNRPDADAGTFSTANMKHSLQSIRVHSGVTKSEFEMPQAAELIYPKLDAAIAQVIADPNAAKSEEAFASRMKNKFKGASAFVADYADRRAQAEYQITDPNSSLAKSTAKPSFASKLADPSHPINSGSIVSLLTGGHLDPVARKREKRAAKIERRNARRAAKGKPLKQSRRQTDALGRRIPKRKGIVSRIIRQVWTFSPIVILFTDWI